MEYIKWSTEKHIKEQFNQMLNICDKEEVLKYAGEKRHIISKKIKIRNITDFSRKSAQTRKQ